MRVYCVLFFSRGEIGMEWADQGGCLSGGQLLCREEQGSVRVLGLGGRRWLERGNGDIYELRGARVIYIGGTQKNKFSLRCILVLGEDFLFRETCGGSISLNFSPQLCRFLWKRLDIATGTRFFSSNTPVL
jgi:hypothetical protein